MIWFKKSGRLTHRSRTFETTPSSPMPHACSNFSRLAFHPEYAAIGSITNLASRLCDATKADQIVVSRRVYGMAQQWVDAAPLDDLSLKGFNHPVLAVEILRWRQEGGDVEVAAAAEPRRRKQPL